MKNSRLLPGALAGLMLTAPLGALFYLFSRVFALAFVPFDLFEWLTRILPGPLVITGIEGMKTALIALGLSVARYSKMTEYIIALVIFLLLGMVVAAVYFQLFGKSAVRSDSRYGLFLGAAIGFPVALIVAVADTVSPAPQVVNVVYTLGAYLGWGALVRWSMLHMIAAPAPPNLPSAKAPELMTLHQVNRRRFLIRSGAATAAITVIGSGLGAVVETAMQNAGTASTNPRITPSPIPTRGPLPNTDAALIPAPGTRPEYTPVADHYRIDITLQHPRVDGATYKLPVRGLVGSEMSLTLNDLRKYPPMEQYITLACISNNVGGDLIGTTKWTGVSLQNILKDVDVLPAARYLYIEAADGFFESVSLDEIASDERVMLAYDWDGMPLTQEHGFPLRIYIPNRYGMKQPKWITRLELVAAEKLGYWVIRAWDHDAFIKATSVIDTVAVDDIYTDESGQKRVPIGGIAFAGSRSVSKVQVRVNDRDWEDAELRKPLSDLTWVIWRYDWPVTYGEQVFAVRCIDGDGNPQIETYADVFPSGASGIDQMKASIS
jgi:DMSO/TMAO reductase YedYZ molybdopterin-dependent catalytic subunit